MKQIQLIFLNKLINKIQLLIKKILSEFNLLKGVQVVLEKMNYRYYNLCFYIIIF